MLAPELPHTGYYQPSSRVSDALCGLVLGRSGDGSLSAFFLAGSRGVFGLEVLHPGGFLPLLCLPLRGPTLGPLAGGRPHRLPFRLGVFLRRGFFGLFARNFGRGFGELEAAIAGKVVQDLADDRGGELEAQGQVLGDG
jgi:hypothetical protein